MTVSEVIEELRKWPAHAPVRVVMGSVYFADEAGETMIDLCDEDATEAEDVRPGGGFVLIRGK